jgi:dihydroorotate dehydrogenase (NAD+) catalytic subunit
MQKPFFDPHLSYYENYKKGPFANFSTKKVSKAKIKPDHFIFGLPVFTPFGIPAGPLLNAKFVNYALDKGFDLSTYKTVRTKEYISNDWPNVLAVKVKGDLTLKLAEKGLIADHNYSHHQSIAITNSFGVPSMDPYVWQPDMKKAVDHAKEGQVVIGSFQGTTNPNGNVKEYIKDFVLASRLVKETGAIVLEANMSCPNEGSAHLLCFDIQRTAQIVNEIKNEIGNTPLIIKIAYFSDQRSLEKLIELVGRNVDGISAVNTIPAKIYDKEGNPALTGKNRLISGVCGAPIRWAGLEMVRRLKEIRENKFLSFKIIGVGGVTKPKDYFDYRRAGADAVMSATGAMWNSYLAKEIKSLT